MTNGVIASEKWRNKMEELWKDVVGYEGLYQVSNLGRVKRIKTQHILSPAISYGYHRVNLSKKGKCKMFQVHRLVAFAFIPNPENYPCINHKDEVKNNNHVENLEWCTQKYNNSYGTFPSRIAATLSKPIIQKTLDGKFIRNFNSATQAQRETGIWLANIRRCVVGNYKTAGGYIWEKYEGGKE